MHSNHPYEKSTSSVVASADEVGNRTFKNVVVAINKKGQIPTDCRFATN
jgi:hypothetical protein